MMLNRRQQNVIDKSSWKDGEWKYEPDFVDWIDPNTEFNCMILRNQHTGELCGYVGVTETNPFYLKSIMHPCYDGISVHGDPTWCGWLTKDSGEIYSDYFKECYSKLWWVGFDCAHIESGDILPVIDDELLAGLEAFRKMISGNKHILEIPSYKNISFVQANVSLLAGQLSMEKTIQC